MMLANLLSFDALLLSTTVVAQAGILGFIVAALVTALILILCAYILPGVYISDFGSALLLGIIAGAIVGLFNYIGIGDGNGIIGGIIALIVSAAALLIGDKLMDGVRIDGFGWALATAAIIGLVNGFLPSLF